MTAVYLASRYERREELRKHASQFTAAGFEVVSSWLWTDLGATADEARMCLADLDRADTLVFFAEDPAIGWPRGSRCVEYGYALRAGKRLLVVGERENLFHQLLTDADVFKTADDLITALLKETITK